MEKTTLGERFNRGSVMKTKSNEREMVLKYGAHDILSEVVLVTAILIHVGMSHMVDGM